MVMLSRRAAAVQAVKWPRGAGTCRLRAAAILPCVLCLAVVSVLDTSCTSWAAGRSGAATAPPPGRRERRQLYERLRPGRGRTWRVQMRQRSDGALGGESWTDIVGEETLEDVSPGAVELDEHQRRAAVSVLSGRNVFITGGAGTGKTFTLQVVLGALEMRYGEDYMHKVAVTASTGVASVLIGGCTLHHLAGVGAPVVHSDFRKISREPFAHIWKTLDVLVIDEISMISGEFLDLFDGELRRLRDSERAFGGLQVVFVGDPFQLPPIEAKLDVLPNGVHLEELGENRVVFGLRGTHELFLNRGMFFESESYWRADFEKVELALSHRQDDDSEFYQTLRLMRRVKKKDRSKVVKIFNNRCDIKAFNSTSFSDYGQTYLVPRVKGMNDINNAHLKQLPSRAWTFKAIDEVKVSKDLYSHDEDTQGLHDMVEQYLRDESGFFDPDSSSSPIPEAVTLKLGARVMLVANVQDIHLGLVNGATGIVTELHQKWVEVEFDGVGRQNVPFHRFTWSFPTLGACSREQIPLALSWAMTHHKAQGKTISKACVDPEAFSEGQAYVALSRTKSFDDLRLLRRCKKTDINPCVESDIFLEFHDNPEKRNKLGTWKDKPLPESIGKLIEALEEEDAAFEEGWR